MSTLPFYESFLTRFFLLAKCVDAGLELNPS